MDSRNLMSRSDNLNLAVSFKARTRSNQRFLVARATTDSLAITDSIFARATRRGDNSIFPALKNRAKFITPLRGALLHLIQRK